MHTKFHNFPRQKGIYMTREELKDKTDDQLMEMVRDENLKQAFDVLVLRHYREAVRFCMTMLKEEQSALDIVQDSFADIYVQRKRLFGSCAFRTYLFAVVKHKAVDQLRKNARQRTEELDTGKTDVPGLSPPSPEELYVRKEEYAELLQWIEELPEDYRQALILFCVDGMSYEEIAAAMGKSLPQVRILLHRARKKLQRQRREQV